MMANSLGLFAAFYFGVDMTYKFPSYAGDFWEDGENLTDGFLREALWLAYAESTKTTNAKILATWWIVTAQKHYINFDSWDKKIAEQSLFDITLWLQTNAKLRKDWGDMYIEERHDREKKQMKRMGEFITTNNIKVEAFSIGISPRGRIFGNIRPDAFIIDDIENKKTIRSAARTQQIIDHVDEVKRGLGPISCILYCGNYISDAGVMRHIRDRVAQDPKGMVRDIPVMDRITGEIAWKDKYCHTDEEAAKINADPTRRTRPIISLEDKRRFLGDAQFEAEMMNNPESSGELVFDRPTIDRLLRDVQPIKTNNGGLHVWYQFNAAHRYAIGADTAEGGGGDSNTSVIIDFSTTPNRQVASYASNTIEPDSFGHELKREGYLYGACLVCPEINNTGFATITALKNDKYPNIYRREEQDKIQNKLTKKIGWRTTEGNKYSIILEVKRAVEDGELLILDKRILDEMREFTQNDMRGVAGLTTRHFDLLKAVALAWAMRSLAKVSEQNAPEYKQPAYEGNSNFEGQGFSDPKGEDMFDMFDDSPFKRE